MQNELLFFSFSFFIQANFACILFLLNSFFLSVNHIIQCSSKVDEPILIKLSHNDQWPSPQMPNDPWPRQRSFEVTGVKFHFFSSKCIFFYKQHAILTWVGHMTRHQSVSMGCTQIWGQRSLRGHFRSESKNLQNVSSFTNNMWYWHELVIWLDISRCLWGVHRFGVKGHLGVISGPNPKIFKNVSSFTNNMWYWQKLVIWLDISRCLWGLIGFEVKGH